MFSQCVSQREGEFLQNAVELLQQQNERFLDKLEPVGDVSRENENAWRPHVSR